MTMHSMTVNFEFDNGPEYMETTISVSFERDGHIVAGHVSVYTMPLATMEVVRDPETGTVSAKFPEEELRKHAEDFLTPEVKDVLIRQGVLVGELML